MHVPNGYFFSKNLVLLPCPHPQPSGELITEYLAEFKNKIIIIKKFENTFKKKRSLSKASMELLSIFGVLLIFYSQQRISQKFYITFMVKLKKKNGESD